MEKTRVRAYQMLVMAVLVALLSMLPRARGQAGSPDIKLLISPEQPFVGVPDAARIQMHIHNLTPQTLWLYRRAKGKHPAEEGIQEENQPVRTSGGSTVEFQLQPADAQAARAATTPALATVLEYVDMPKPRLVKLPGGGDYEETSIVQFHPALAEGQKPLWGTYQLTGFYGASFSNAGEFQRNIGANLWQGEVTSNTIRIELRPALPDSVGVLNGSALAQDLHPLAGVRVSLQEEQGQLIDQQVTGPDGRFAFSHLPLTTYWVTGRREHALEDTVTFHHEELTSAAPTGDMQLVFYPPEITEAKQIIHKPVLFRTFDSRGRSVGGLMIDAVFSNGDVLDDVKATSGDDGFALLELIPGRISVSLKQHGCAEQVERADVTAGPGVDSFKFVFDCTKK